MTPLHCMRAAVLHAAHDVRVEAVPVPTLGPDDVLVRVRACGLCASDVHYFETGAIGRYVVSQPMILGHEVAGDVVAVGARVTTPAPGTRVAIEPGVTCGRCRFCTSGRYNLCESVSFYATPPIDGALAEYAVIRTDRAHPIPDHMTYVQGALAEPLAVGVHATRLTHVGPGMSVLVMGAGPIGLLAGVAALHAGADQVLIADVFPTRLDAARRLGASVALDVHECDLPSEISTRTHGEGVDVIIDTSGNRGVLEQAPLLARRGGAVAIVGLPTNDAVMYAMNTIVDNELTLQGVFRYANAFPASIALIATGRYPLDSIVTHHLPLEEVERGLQIAIQQKDRAIKVMITP